MKTKVTFTEDVEVKDHKGDVKFAAKEGETMELEAPSASRWIRRGKAVEGSPEKKPKISKPKKDDKSTDGTTTKTDSDSTDA